MKKFVSITMLICWSQAFAGGAIGGNPGLVKEELALSLRESAFNVEALPKTPVSGDEFRRIRARLAVDGVHSVPALVGSETIQVRKLQSSIVDTSITKELLPFDTVDSGTVGGSPGLN